MRFALLDDVPAPLAVYPPGGIVSDSTQLQGSALAFTVEKTLCDDPVSQTPNSDGDQCVCKQGFFDADLQDGELVCQQCAVGTYRDNIVDPTCLRLRQHEVLLMQLDAPDQPTSENKRYSYI